MILASLSLGYYIGGFVADKRPETKPLAVIIFLSAVAILITFFLKDIISSLITLIPFSIELKSILISVMLFAPASFFLGMVSPYAVRLRIKDSEKAGRTAGNLYAISTLGSIFGTFLGGFYLIPNFGSNASLLSLSIILVITSALLLGRAIFSNWFKFFFIIPIVFFISFSFFVGFSGNFLKTNVIADIDTLYSKILVYKGIDEKTKKPANR